MKNTSLQTQDHHGRSPLAVKIYKIPTSAAVELDEGFSDLLILARGLSEHLERLDLPHVKVRLRIANPSTLQIDFDLLDAKVGEATMVLLGPPPTVAVNAMGVISQLELAICSSFPHSNHESAIRWVGHIALRISDLTNVWAPQDISSVINCQRQ